MSDIDPYEFDGWLIAPTEVRPLMSKPPTYQASKAAIAAVSDAVERADGDMTALADWLVNLMERYGARSAKPAFIVVHGDGTGPCCSWCGAIWPMCGHHHFARPDSDDDEGAGA